MSFDRIFFSMMDKNDVLSTDEFADEEEIFRNFDADAQIIIRSDLLP